MVRNACMTCYEPLRPEEPLAQAEPMAYHIMKWWRNKFRSGYKKFSLGTDSERTDTEELVGRAPSQCSAPPDVLPSEARALLHTSSPQSSHRRPRKATPPPSPPPTPPENRDKNRIRFEELTCDVQVEHELPQQQPLQFSFTLYDLDGHGRMTKDDIAGIVSTIYESVGKSVTVPHYGSKTIQVRLTVVPETRSQRSHRPKRRMRKNHDDEEIPKKNNSDDDNAQPLPRHKRRSGSLQRRQLLQIIQANMEKNNLNFQPHRKSHDQKPPNIQEEVEPTTKPHRHRSRACTFSEKVNHEKLYKQEPPHNYLDLAQDKNIYDKPRVDRSPIYEVRPEKNEPRHRVEERTHAERIYDRPEEVISDPNLCRYDRYLHAVICSSAKHANTGFHHKNIPKTNRKPHKGQHRSKSHEVRAGGVEPRVLQIIFL